MINTNFRTELDKWISNHSEPSDCERCSSLGFWRVAKISPEAAVALDIHDKRIASRVIPSPQAALLECSGCKRVTIIDEYRLSLL
jgi:hypothetical protein